MVQPFLEERLPACIRLGASWGDDYRVEVTINSAGAEHRRLVHPYPMRRFRISYVRGAGEMHDAILALYNRAFGRFAGFRVKAIDDYTTNARTLPPTAFDQPLEFVSTGVYQLQKQYGTNGTPISIGYPVRTIYKPVTGTTLVGIRNVLSGDFAVAGSTVDTTTGRVTLPADIQRSITSISQATQAVVGVGSGHGIVAGRSVYFSGVVGMTQINGLRGTVVTAGASTITVNIDTTLFTAYSSGGQVNTRPQTGETVYGGCEFDIPCRFDSAIDVTPLTPGIQETADIDLVELIAL